MDARESLERIAAEAVRGELSFPTHAEVAMRVRLALDDPEQHLDQAVQLVQAEPLLAARVVAVANSVAYNRSGRTIADVKNAVARLGFQLVRALASAVVMRQMVAGAVQGPFRVHAERLWEHTAHVAALCHVLARRLTRRDPDIAFFTGLVHEVGGFYLISRAAEYPGILERGVDPSWEQGGERQVGGAVLRSLAVPGTVLAAIESFWSGEWAESPETLAGTLGLAHRLTPIASPLQVAANAACMPESGVPDIDADLAAFLLESAEELDSLTAALKF